MKTFCVQWESISIFPFSVTSLPKMAGPLIVLYLHTYFHSCLTTTVTPYLTLSVLPLIQVYAIISNSVLMLANQGYSVSISSQQQANERWHTFDQLSKRLCQLDDHYYVRCNSSTCTLSAHHQKQERASKCSNANCNINAGYLKYWPAGCAVLFQQIHPRAIICFTSMINVTLASQLHLDMFLNFLVY